MYYEISESTARRAKEMNSFSDYKEGSATSEYCRMVDEAKRVADAQKARVDPMYHEAIDRLLDTYARKLARNLNEGYSIETRCPSMMITGGSNFPVRKKEKQNAARDRNMQEYNYIKGLLDKIRSTGMGGISSDDPNAIAKLEAKLKGMEEDQQTMKAVNAYYRKNKTFEGCPGISTEDAAKIEAQWESGWYKGIPFPPYSLSNNNANIHRIRERLEGLKKRQEAQAPDGWSFDGGRVEMNKEENRVQIFFDEKPDADMRASLKSDGFRWAPSQSAWQRQLTSNGIAAAKRVTRKEA